MKKPNASPAKTPLHLGKFAPQTEPANDDSGQTMMIRRIAADTANRQPARTEEAGDQFGLPVPEMLGVMVYCYTRGVFCSKDIAEYLKEEPALRKSIGRNLPDEATIRRFRRQFAEAIEEALEKVYRIYPADAGESASAKGQTKILRRRAADRLHEATWADNTKGRIG